MLPVIPNTLWFLSCLPQSFAFHNACHDVAGVQRKLLLELIRHNAETEFGRRYGFCEIRSAEEYQARVPLSTYEDYVSSVERIGEGQLHVLTRDRVLLVEPTSGSTAPTKYIPYTASLKTEFQRAIGPWIVNLFSRYPRLLLGQAYWSVTPLNRQNQRTSGGIGIGFDEESQYLGQRQSRWVQSVMAVPPLVKQIGNLESFRYVTLLFLLRSRYLALVSVWNPSFLILLVERLFEWSANLADDIERGTLSPPSELPPNLKDCLLASNFPNPQRAREIRQIFGAAEGLPKVHTSLWPRLRLISCWADGYASLYLSELMRLFPQASVQPKGLLATEGVVSFPLLVQRRTAQPQHALAVRSHFFEFLPTTSPATSLEVETSPLLAHQLVTGSFYSVVLTTGGGLYRYRLADIVEVVGYLGKCPLLRFVGKEAAVSDRFGEKLNERHVSQALERSLKNHGIRATFVMVACDDRAKLPAYTLYIETTQCSDEHLKMLGESLERALLENYHYRYCRDLGQLGTLAVFRIESGAQDTYLSVCQAEGQRLGDIKPAALHRFGGWTRAFRGSHLAQTQNEKTLPKTICNREPRSHVESTVSRIPENHPSA